MGHRRGQEVSSDAAATRRHVFLVGVAGVGKSTLGQAVAARLGMHFADVDVVTEHGVGMAIGEMLERAWGDARVDAALGHVFADLVSSDDSSIVAAFSRLVDRPGF